MRNLTLIFMLGLLCMIFPATVRAQGSDLAALHETTHYIKTGTLFEWSECSATAIGPHAILTASHCEEASDEVTVDGTVTGIFAILRDGNDHSIMLLEDMEFKHYATVIEIEPKQGDEVFYWGNPNDHLDIFRRGYFVGTMDLPWADSGKRKSLMFDMNIGEGDSGAGIFNEKGDVFTVQSFNRNDVTFSKEMAGALPMKFTAAELREAREF